MAVSLWCPVISQLGGIDFRVSGRSLTFISRSNAGELRNTILKGVTKKTSFFKNWGAIFTGTGSHRGLKVSELGVLMSTPSSEKDSPLWLPVPIETAPQFLKKEVFFVTPFNAHIVLLHSCKVLTIQATKCTIPQLEWQKVQFLHLLC